MELMEQERAAAEAPQTGRGNWRILTDAFNRYVMEGGLTHGAALTYYAVFSLGPLLLVATAIAGWFFGEEAARGELRDKLVETFGPDTAWTIEGLLAGVRARTVSGWAAIIGVIVLLYSASSVMRQLKESMNFIWRVPHLKEATWWKWAEHYLVSLVGVLIAGLLLIVSLLSTTFLAAMKKYLPEGLPYSGNVLLSVEFGATVVLVTVVCALIFKFLPETSVLWRYVWLGAFGTALMFSLGKLGMGLYLGWLSAESFYGAMSSFMILLFWMYYSAQVLVLGAYFTEMTSRTRMAVKAARGQA
ncbi:MAG: YihY/virulence factor BrkB family protein [Chthoniobacterales bacterium]|jgi:membrane protein